MQAVLRRCARGTGTVAGWLAMAVVLLLAGAAGGCRGAREAGSVPAASSATDAGEVRVELRAEPARARIGDRVQVRMTVDHPRGDRIEWPEPAPPWEVRAREVRPPDGRGARARSELRLELLTFELGSHALFTNAIVRVRHDGTREEIAPPELRVEIPPTVGGEVSGPRDIKPPLPWPPAWPRWLWALPVVVLTALLAALAARWASSRRRRPPPPPPPPDRVALEALARLRERGWIEAGLAEPFYVELSAIVRSYLEARFGLRAPERTTEEFIREAAESPALSAGHRALVAEFLQESDLVKFARARPGPEAMRRALEVAERFIRETVPPTVGAAPGGSL